MRRCGQLEHQALSVNLTAQGYIPPVYYTPAPPRQMPGS